MIRLRRTAPYIRDIVRKLQDAGFETYIVGGAVRDLLLDRSPKDYDLSTAATPTEIRNVFGRRQARIIGKRFRLVHLHVGKEIIEISTFRRRPETPGEVPEKLVDNEALPENMIFEDNDFGTAQEDAFRRDFTVNALFYDPVHDNLLDFTGMGMDDIRNRVVRVIGNCKERFEEDPVRLLRALKLVGQYGFSFEPETEKALVDGIPLIQHASPSRLSLELEKILASCFSDRIFATLQRYGFLRYFMPFFDENWNTPAMQRAMQMLNCRNRRVTAERYRASISVAVASLALPIAAARFGSGEEGALWDEDKAADEDGFEDLLREIFRPHCIVKRVIYSASKMLMMQPAMFSCRKVGKLASSKSLSHARELLYIQNELWWHRSDLIEVWERPKPAPDAVEQPAAPRRRGRRHRKTSTPLQ